MPTCKANCGAGSSAGDFALAIDAGGRAVVAGAAAAFNSQGYGNYVTGVVRLTTSGSPDTGFDDDGWTWAGPARSGTPGGAGLAIDDDAGLLVASLGVTSPQDFSLARLSLSGGCAYTAWTVTGDFAGGYDYVYGTALRTEATRPGRP